MAETSGTVSICKRQRRFGTGRKNVIYTITSCWSCWEENIEPGQEFKDVLDLEEVRTERWTMLLEKRRTLKRTVLFYRDLSDTKILTAWFPRPAGDQGRAKSCTKESPVKAITELTNIN